MRSSQKLLPLIESESISLICRATAATQSGALQGDLKDVPLSMSDLFGEHSEQIVIDEARRDANSTFYLDTQEFAYGSEPFPPLYARK